ncbi:MAG: PqqD family protein [Ruminococcaceae bacterium]|nr:PqqD family protein [Oscillospiraceae bacterium]
MKLKKEIVLGNIDGENFAIATGGLSDKIHGLIRNNKTAAFIFELLQKEQTEDSIVNAMCQKYDAPEDVIRADVKSVLEQLENLGITE